MSQFKITISVFFLSLLLTCLAFPAAGQKKEKLILNVTVTDEAGNAIHDARISSSKNRYIYAGRLGSFNLAVYPDDVLKVMAKGYETKIISADQLESSVELQAVPDFSGEEDRISTLYGETTKRRTVGAYSKIDGRQLEANPTMHFYNALGGRLNGLFTMDNTMVPGFTNSSNFIRTPKGNMMVLVDGVERTLDYLEPETVESVQILKDASLKSLYGGIHTDGILMIKTRRGRPYENSARINVQTGIQQPLRLPEYLNAYDYAVLHNQVMRDAGMEPCFNPEGYLTGDPLLYPDVDYYGMFLNDHLAITRANLQYQGGSRQTRFFTHLGYQTNGGLEKYTEYPNRDKVFTLRGNIDNTILGFITLEAGFNAAMQTKSWPNMSTQDFFNMLSDNRPNEFPIFIPGENVGEPEKEFVLGGVANNRNNPYGHLMNRGYAEREYIYVQTDFSLDFNLDKWIKGLSLKPVLTVDVYNILTCAQGATYVVFEPTATGDPDRPIAYTSWGKETRETSKSRTGNDSQRNYAFNLTAAYNRVFGKHDINALLVYYRQTKEFRTLHNTLKRLNFGGLVNYLYDDKYAAEISLNRVGVGSFSKSERFRVFPTFGAGWILSEESFIPKKSWLNYLKLRASYGILGSTSYTSEGLFSAYLYRDVWEPGGTYANTGGGFTTNIASETQTGNPDVGYQKSYEWNAGADLLLFRRSLSLSAGYFYNLFDGELANMGDVTPGITGKNAALMMQNNKQYKSYGWEAEAMFEKRISDWKLSAGVNLCHGETHITKENNPPYPETYAGLMKIEKMGDVKGQRVIGTFADPSDVDASPRQDFGTVRPGDLKYDDANNDRVVDDRDRIVIANTTPSLEYGITLKIEYKGVNLDVMGYGLSGFDRNLNSKYFQLYGARKYSSVAVDGLPNGNPHPILRPEYANNNFIDSDYWVMRGDYFKIRNVELGYTLPHHLTSKIGINAFKIFARGFNLLTFSKLKTLDPENLDAGISNFPLCRTLTGGVSIEF
ncbi:MAG: SusC/RagA family TonB-linked outer membrane protein [Bacteroidales bacterium]|jgi:TonB-linked SusC/RagA family outer membrane protein|nr:SusC/RagA family TonB-linked outer membrane protein [Bacteroidales bacterium]